MDLYIREEDLDDLKEGESFQAVIKKREPKRIKVTIGAYT